MRVLTGCHAGGDGEVPRVTVECRQLRFDGETALSEQCAQAVCRRTQPQRFAGGVGVVNQGDVTAVDSCGFTEFAGGVVAQVGGNVHLRVGGAHSVKEGVTGTTAEGDAADRLVGASGDAQATGGCGQCRSEAFCKLLEGDFFGQGAEAAGAYRVFLLVKYLGLRFSERFAVDETDSVTECFVHTFDGGIGVGVRAEQSASTFNKGVQNVAFVVAVGDELCAA